MINHELRPIFNSYLWVMFFQFFPSRHISLKTPGFVHRPSSAQEVPDYVDIVLDASTLYDMSAPTRTTLNDFKNLSQEKGKRHDRVFINIVSLL